MQSDLFRRAAADCELPNAPRHFQAVPWSEFTPGDMLKYKDDVNKVLKLYFAGLTQSGPRGALETDMETLFVYDAATRLMTRPVVTRVGDDIDEPVMRIRCACAAWVAWGDFCSRAGWRWLSFRVC